VTAFDHRWEITPAHLNGSGHTNPSDPLACPPGFIPTAASATANDYHRQPKRDAAKGV